MNRRIPLLRGWAILAVVCNHATAWTFIAMFWWVHRYRPVTSPNYDQLSSLPHYVLTALNQLALFSVPAFLLISGFFIAYAARGEPPVLSWKVIRTRLLALLWPYLIWSAVVFVIDALLGTVHSPIEYVTRLLTGNAVGAYFFIPLLAQFYLLSPFLVRWVKARPWLLLALSALLQLALVGLPYLGLLDSSVALQRGLRTLDWVFIRWVFYFVLGVVVGFRRKQVADWLARYRWVMLALTVLLGASSVLESQLLYQAASEWDWAYAPLKLSSTLYATFFILAFLGWASRPSTLSRTIERIGGMSYGIYLLHPKALELTAKVIYHLAPALLGYHLVLALVLFAMVLGGSWLLMTIMAKLPMRKVYRYLFG